MGIIQPANLDEKEFYRHILDLAEIGKKSRLPRFSFFLTEREQQLAKAAAQSVGVEYGFWGGYENAERKIFSSPPADEEEYPSEPITFTYRRNDKLSHRDFLGALMSLGVKRNQIGDIAVAEGGAVIFASKNISPLIIDEIDKVGRVGVKISSGINIEIPKQEFEKISLVAASLRIDAIISAACKISREKASLVVKSGSVVLNGAEIYSPGKDVRQSDIFTVKGQGKFILSELGNETKKGKIHIVLKKYK